MLTQLLKQMYEDAIKNNKVPQKRKLKNGLHLEITSHPGGINLKISRDKVYPSKAEWIIITRMFPYFVGSVEPRQTVDNQKRFALIGELPSRDTVMRQMSLDQLR